MTEADKAPSEATEVKRIQVYAGPTGFLLLALLFLVLPAATASCSADENGPELGSISASVTGADLVVGGDPDYTPTGMFELSAEGNADMARDATPQAAVRVFGIATIAVMGLGLLTMFVQVWRLRAWVTAVIAAVAAVLLVSAELAMIGQWESIAEDTAEFMVYLPQTQGIDVVGRADEVVSAGLGYWLTLGGLVLITGVNAFMLLYYRTKRRSRE